MMKTTSAALALGCCIFFLFTVTNLTAEKDGLDVPFCPLDAKTARYIQSIKAMLQGIPSNKKRRLEQVRSTHCNSDNLPIPLPNCDAVSLMVDNGHLAGKKSMHDCCDDCKNNISDCLSRFSCADCVFEQIACMERCTVINFCQKDNWGQQQTSVGYKRQTRQAGPRHEQHRKQYNVCPTSIEKIDQSFCIKRACIPIDL